MKRYLVWALGICCLVTNAGYSLAAGRGDMRQSARGTSWDTAVWPGDGKGYLQLLPALERAFVPSMSEAALLNAYHLIKQAAWQRPNDLQARFRWGMASYYAFKYRASISGADMMACREALAASSTPRDYAFTRLRFLFEKVRGDTADRVLRPVGARLLKRNPHDHEVKSYYIGMLPLVNATERKLALKYAQELTRDRPRDPQSYDALAGVYESIWVMSNLQPIPGAKVTDPDHPPMKWSGTRDKTSKEHAVAAYRKALSLVKPGEPKQGYYRLKIQLLTSEHGRV
jgi:hypothetical protein